MYVIFFHCVTEAEIDSRLLLLQTDNYTLLIPFLSETCTLFRYLWCYMYEHLPKPFKIPPLPAEARNRLPLVALQIETLVRCETEFGQTKQTRTLELLRALAETDTPLITESSESVSTVWKKCASSDAVLEAGPCVELAEGKEMKACGRVSLRSYWCISNIVADARNLLFAVLLRSILL